ncbi:MAG TPA: formylglycine-generating enzyme family protein, partial [Gemmataceae bacterium]|nr:formylglycine-generating enzyme family protein [Gemmataceae bacterium]
FRGQPATIEPIPPGPEPTPQVPVVAKGPPSNEGARQEPPPAVAPFDANKAKEHQEAWAKHLGVPVEFTNSLGMTFRLIPPGEFQMGIDAKDVDTSKWTVPPDWPPRFLGENWPEAVAGASPKHPVKLTRAFYIQTHEVRHGWYRKMLGPVPEIDAGADPHKPVHDFVSWPDAIAFCNALSKHEGRKLCYAQAGDEVILAPGADGYRLPTEAEWEFACRGGTLTPWFFECNPFPNQQALWRYQSEHAPAPRPNPFGLFDMYAGSTEWVWDGYDYYRPEATVDPVVPPGRNPRLLRGSSCYDHAGGAFWSANSFHRLPVVEPTKRHQWFGFGRVAISIPVPASGERSAFRTAGGHIPFTDADVMRITALPAEKQLDAVAEELARRNPGLDVAALKASAQFEDGKVILVALNAPYLADLSPLRALPGIPRVHLNGTTGINLATLDGSTMDHLALDGAITNLSGLPRLPSLKALEVQCPTLTDVSALNGWQLRSLSLHYSSVEDLSPLRGMPLVALNVHRTKVKDLSPLRGMKLETFLYMETEIQDISVLRDMPLRDVGCDYLPRRDEAVLKAIPTLVTINGKPVAEFWKDVKDE